MSSVITTDFEKWKAQQVAAGQPVVLDEFVFANVPGLDPAQVISRDEKLPIETQIVHRQAVNKTGLASENAVAYSVTLGTEVGNFDFNWIGLINKTSGVIGMITHAPTQKKIKTANGLQGNVLNRSFLLEFDGAATETAITTTAETWQIDFTARLSGIDEMQRLINTDSYGEAAFFGDSFAVVRQGEQYVVKKGLAYVGGLRGELEFDQTLNSLRNTRVYVDFSYQGNLVSQWKTVVKIVAANELKNSVDAAGYPHYMFAVARIDDNGDVADLRSKGTFSDRDIAHLQKELSRVKQDYATNSALSAVNNNANDRLEKAKNGTDILNKVEFVNNVGAYPKTGGKVFGEVICKRLVLEADVPYLAGFDTYGERQFFCGRAIDGPLYFKNDTTGAALKITDEFQFNRVVTVPNVKVKAEIPYIAGFDSKGKRQFFCGRASDGPLYLINDETEARLKITDEFQFNRVVTVPNVKVKAEIPYIAGFDSKGKRQFFCGRASDGPLYLINDETEATLKITDEFQFNRVVTVPNVKVKAEIPYIAGFDSKGKRQFFCGRASDGPLYLINDETEARLKVTDVFYFNSQVIPANYANFDQRYQICGEIRLFPFRPAELPLGWHHCNGERHLVTSAIGRALAQLSGSYKSDFKITVSGNYINLPNFYLDGRGLFMRPSTTPGQIFPDTFRAHSHPESVSSIEGGRVNYAENTAVSWGRSISTHYAGLRRPETTEGGAETAPIHIGMTPAIFLGV